MQNTVVSPKIYQESLATCSKATSVHPTETMVFTCTPYCFMRPSFWSLLHIQGTGILRPSLSGRHGIVLSLENAMDLVLKG